jgi:hypothetical protein
MPTEDELRIKELKKLGVDVDYLRSLPRGRPGVEWPVAWKMGCKILFIAGFNPVNIEQMLQGPNRQTIYTWADAGDWITERDKFIADTTKKALDKAQDSVADINARHIKALQTAQNAGMLAIVGNKVQAKSLEGTISAVIQAIKAERDISQIGGGNGNQTIIDQRIQVVQTTLDQVPPERIAEFLDLQRKRMELDDEINAFSSGESVKMIDTPATIEAEEIVNEFTPDQENTTLEDTEQP